MIELFVGGEQTMKSIAKSGCIRVLNRKTMKWQDFGRDATYEAIKDPNPNISTGWILLCSRDVKAEAISQGFIV